VPAGHQSNLGGAWIRGGEGAGSLVVRRAASEPQSHKSAAQRDGGRGEYMPAHPRRTDGPGFPIAYEEIELLGQQRPSAMFTKAGTSAGASDRAPGSRVASSSTGTRRQGPCHHPVGTPTAWTLASIDRQLFSRTSRGARRAARPRSSSPGLRIPTRRTAPGPARVDGGHGLPPGRRASVREPARSTSSISLEAMRCTVAPAADSPALRMRTLSASGS
jgi:hypothetical protein